MFSNRTSRFHSETLVYRFNGPLDRRWLELAAADDHAAGRRSGSGAAWNDSRSQSHAGPERSAESSVGPGENHEACRWVEASEASVCALFASDPGRRRRFLHFLRAGTMGIFLVRSGRWITYGWSTLPGLYAPPHLPRWTRGLNAYWIFYCHTREEFRGQGHFKHLLARLVDAAYAREPHPLVLCDTLPGNFASRSVALQIGFVPVGVLRAYRVGVPGLGGIAMGGAWRTEEAHRPQMPSAPSRI
jgi:hypothetical protein